MALIPVRADLVDVSVPTAPLMRESHASFYLERLFWFNSEIANCCEGCKLDAFGSKSSFTAG